MDSVIIADKSGQKYIGQIIGLCALVFMGVWMFGPRSLSICLFTVCSCLVTDLICYGLRGGGGSIKDLSAVTCGLSLSLMLPATVNTGIAVFVGALCIVAAKHSFGGVGNYIFSLPAFGFAFITICYPKIFTMYPKLSVNLPFTGKFNFTSAASIDSLLKKGTSPNLDVLDIVTGKFPGGIGTTHILVLVIIAICLILIRSISGTVVLTGLGSFAVLSYMFPRLSDRMDSVVYEIIGGYVLFGFIFLASDITILPRNRIARVMYGFLTAMITVILRNFGRVECGFCFALLISNAFTGEFDRFADSVVNAVKNGMVSFERERIEIQRGMEIKLTDTQEIDIPKEYMPSNERVDGDEKIDMDDISE